VALRSKFLCSRKKLAFVVVKGHAIKLTLQNKKYLSILWYFRQLSNYRWSQ